MARLIILNNEYSPTLMENIFNYVSDNTKANGLIGAQNMILNHCFEQAMAVNRYFNITENKVIHFILSFSDNDHISPSEAFYKGYEICRLRPEYQILFAVHQNTKNLHIHFAMNPVSLIDGHKFYFNDVNINSFAEEMRDVFMPYGIPVGYTFSNSSNNFKFSEQMNYSIRETA